MESASYHAKGHNRSRTYPFRQEWQLLEKYKIPEKVQALIDKCIANKKYYMDPEFPSDPSEAYYVIQDQAACEVQRFWHRSV